MREKLRTLRKQHHWTTQWTAQSLKISRRMYVSIESGERTPSKATMDKLEDLFGFSQRELLADNDTKSEAQEENKS